MEETLFNLGIHESWNDIMIPLFQSEEMLNIRKVIGECTSKGINVYPKKALTFRAFSTSVDDIRVVILGQCPYPDGRGTGLAFAVDLYERRIPYSLGVIHAELEDTYYPQRDYNSVNIEQLGQELLHWGDQGVLLLNSALTVQHGKAGSHLKYWRSFTETILKYISDKHTGIIFCLWGRVAHTFEPFIDKQFHYILKASHPAYGSYMGEDKFIGCGHFTKIDEILLTNNNLKINWYNGQKGI